MRSPAQLPRRLSLWDCLGIGINGIVGSGVYLLVGPLAARGGTASVVGVVACGGLCILIALSFAELSGIYDRSGGPYVYARDAFGPVVGFAVGWLGMATGVLGLAAVSVGFAGALARVVPALSSSRTFVAVGLICILGIVNFIGVKAAGRTSLVLSICKVAPLVLLALLGLASMHGALPALAPPPGKSFGAAVSSSAFLAIFMMSGFEYAAVPAGEVVDARRNVPLAVVGSLAFATALYAALQLVAVATLPDAGAREQPLFDVASAIFGPAGFQLTGAAALLSMAGFCAGVALVAPRYFFALAEDGYLPARIASLGSRGTPGAAIATSTALASGLAIVLGYASLVDVANVVILSGYALTSLACATLRVRRPDAPRRYRLPFGPLVPLLAVASACALLVSARPRVEEWRFCGLLLVLGFAAWGATALRRRLGG
jgi:basic amino acid/polyamine antiporter, APA family